MMNEYAMSCYIHSSSVTNLSWSYVGITGRMQAMEIHFTGRQIITEQRFYIWDIFTIGTAKSANPFFS